MILHNNYKEIKMRRIDEVLEKIENKIQPPKISAAIVWWRNDSSKAKTEKPETETAKDNESLVIDGVKLEPVTASTSAATVKDSMKEPAKKEKTVPLTIGPKTHSENGSKPGESPTAPALVPANS
jgi:hypothetical protein